VRTKCDVIEMFNTKEEREEKLTVTALYINICFMNCVSRSESFECETDLVRL